MSLPVLLSFIGEAKHNRLMTPAEQKAWNKDSKTITLSMASDDVKQEVYLSAIDYTKADKRYRKTSSEDDYQKMKTLRGSLERLLKKRNISTREMNNLDSMSVEDLESKVSSLPSSKKSHKEPQLSREEQALAHLDNAYRSTGRVSDDFFDQVASEFEIDRDQLDDQWYSLKSQIDKEKLQKVPSPSSAPTSKGRQSHPDADLNALLKAYRAISDPRSPEGKSALAKYRAAARKAKHGSKSESLAVLHSFLEE